MNSSQFEREISLLKKRIEELEKENKSLKADQNLYKPFKRTVKHPQELDSFFNQAEQLVSDYFKKISMDPSNASIDIEGERYVLMRASSLSIDFLKKIEDLFAYKGKKEAFRVGQNFLFDIAHVIGMEDGRNMHQKLNLKDPLSKMTAGPVHFAFSGWATVELLEGNPSPDDHFLLKYNHPHSFEADSWIRKGIQSEEPVCIMNSGYSSGWCAESFGIPLTAVEISCRAKGDKNCTFVMAPPHKIQEYLDKEKATKKGSENYDIPLFFERQQAEQEIMKSLEEKSILLKEIHHRVKNNLQIITSLLNLQSYYLDDSYMSDKFNETINRIKAMALVHERLFNSTDAKHVNLIEYLESVVELIQDSFAFGHQISLDIDPVINNKVSIETAIPFGLIVNELVSNSIKYAFPNRKDIENCKVDINVSESNGQHIIGVKDNGIGLPEGFTFESIGSLGFEIVISLVEQLNGSIEYENNQGAHIVIKF